MPSNIQELYCFRVKQVVQDDDAAYWRYARDNHRSDYEPSFITKADEATQFTLDQTSEIIKLYQKLIRMTKVVEAQLVKVTITTQIDIIPIDQEEFLEERRRIAIEKLTMDDIHALGVESMATYSTLKFHKAPAPILRESPPF